MKRTFFMMLIVALVGVMVLSACGGGASPTTQGNTSPGGEVRATPPPEYASKTNPMPADQAAIAAGKDIYAINCAACHGETGRGDGPTAASLDPKPKSLVTDMGNMSDAYMYWRIAEGGAFPPFNSAMPAWKASMSEEQIWQVIAHLRTLGQ